MTARHLFWGLFALTLAVYLVMLSITLPAITRAAGGLMPFDLRPGGYGLGEAQAFLSALPADGLALYRQVQLTLDTFYPGLLALTLFFALDAMLPPALRRFRLLLTPMAAPVAIFDYLENHAIAAMLDAGAEGLSERLVADANGWTLLKGQATAVAMCILLALVAWKLASRGLRRRTARPRVEHGALARPLDL